MANASATEKSLYVRLGGYDVIAAIVDEFIQTLMSDPGMARFASTMSLESRRRNRQLTIDYLAAKSGGPTLYLGRDMKTAHEGLGINESEWNVAMGHVQRALVKLKVPERESKELLALFTDLKDQIVER